MIKTALLLFFEFLKIGTFSFGGGLATIPFLYKIADKYDWFTNEELLDMISLSEITPGPLGINMATYVGFKALGIVGSIITVLSLLTPAIIIIIILYKVVLKSRSEKVKHIIDSIKPAAASLFAVALFSIIKSTLYPFQKGFLNTLPETIIFVVSLFCILFVKKIHPTFIILFGGLIGALSYLLR